MMPINVKLKTFTKKQQKCKRCLTCGRREIYHCTVKSRLPKPLDFRKYSFLVLASPPLRTFVWNNKPAKIKRESMIGPKESGGLDLPDYESIKNSPLVSWVKRMIDGKGEAWMAIPSYYLENVGGIFIFECNYEVDLLDLNRLPEFYADIQRRMYTRKPITNPR